MTLEEIIAIEPEVGVILREAAEEAEHGGLPYRVSSRCKARLSRLVGWSSPYPELAAAECYETVLRALFEALEL